MKTILRPVSGEMLALLGVLLLGALELAALITAPPHDRAFVAGAVVAAGSAALVVASAVVHARRNRPPTRPTLDDEQVDESWFTAHAVEGFPMEAVRPWLLRADAPSLNRLYLAWILADHGHDTEWITTHLDLPEPLVQLLVDAARARAH
jgi:hypothetical protein